MRLRRVLHIGLLHLLVKRMDKARVRQGMPKDTPMGKGKDKVVAMDKEDLPHLRQVGAERMTLVRLMLWRHLWRKIWRGYVLVADPHVAAARPLLLILPLLTGLSTATATVTTNLNFPTPKAWQRQEVSRRVRVVHRSAGILRVLLVVLYWGLEQGWGSGMCFR